MKYKRLRYSIFAVTFLAVLTFGLFFFIKCPEEAFAVNGYHTEYNNNHHCHGVTILYHDNNHPLRCSHGWDFRGECNVTGYVCNGKTYETGWTNATGGCGFGCNTGYGFGYGSIDCYEYHYEEVSNSYTVVYNMNGGSGNIGNQGCRYDSAFYISSVVPVRNGYKFLGWSRDSRATSPAYSSSDIAINLTATNNGTVTLYAVWKLDIYDIVLHPGAGNGEEISITGYYGQPCELPKNTYYREGYSFVGWSPKENSKVALYEDEEKVILEEPVDKNTYNLYAVWKPNKYEITLEANGGELADYEKWYVTYDSSTNSDLSFIELSCPEYRFEGWWTEPAEGIMVYDSNGLAINALPYWDNENKWKYTDDVVLYAHWEYAPSISDVYWDDSEMLYFWSEHDDIGKISIKQLTDFYVYNDNELFDTTLLDTGEYYLYVKSIFDRATNQSDSYGVMMTDSSGNEWHRFGPYYIDKTSPRLELESCLASSDNIEISVKVFDEHSGIDIDTCKYYISSNKDELMGGSWQKLDLTFDRGDKNGYGKVNISIDGEWYLVLNAVKDKAGNKCNDYGEYVNIINTGTEDEWFVFGPYNKDSLAPVIEVSPTMMEWTCEDIRLNVSAYDGGSSGLASDNKYQYYVSENASVPMGGSEAWIDINFIDVYGKHKDDATISLRKANGNYLPDGEYYLLILPIRDAAGNISTTAEYHSFGKYKIDRTAPEIKVVPERLGWSNSMVEVTLTVGDTGGSGLDGDNSYEYYISTSPNMAVGGTEGWNSYNPNIENVVRFEASGEPWADGTYYLLVKNIKDNATNSFVEDDYAVFGPYTIDTTRPIVKMTPDKLEYNTGTKAKIFIFEAGDNVGSGLSSENNYQYFISVRDDELVGDDSYPDITGHWIDYSHQEEFMLGESLNGEYYVFIKRVYDNAGNVSVCSGGVDVEVNGTIYHRFGGYRFDTLCPEGIVYYYETPYTLGVFSGESPSEYMIVEDAFDNLVGIDHIELQVYDKSNSQNHIEYSFEKIGDIYRLDFDLYSAFPESDSVQTVGIKVVAFDRLGNNGPLKIASVELGKTNDGGEIPSLAINYIEPEHNPVPGNPGGINDDLEYTRNSFRVLAYVYSVEGNNHFLGGGIARLRLFCYGNVEAVSAIMPSLSGFVIKDYDDEINLVKTVIERQSVKIYEHIFYVPLYSEKGCYIDGVAKGYKGDISSFAPFTMYVDGNILEDFRTILRFGK